MGNDRRNKDSFSGWANSIKSIFNLVVGERKYIERKQLAIRVYMKYDSVHIFAPDLNWAVTSAELKFPKDDLTTFTADIKINSGSSSDIISPKHQRNVKQSRFLKRNYQPAEHVCLYR